MIYDTNLLIRIESPTKTKLNYLVRTNGDSVSAIVRDAVKEYIQKNENKKASQHPAKNAKSRLVNT